MFVPASKFGHQKVFDPQLYAYVLTMFSNKTERLSRPIPGGGSTRFPTIVFLRQCIFSTELITKPGA